MKKLSSFKILSIFFFLIILIMPLGNQSGLAQGPAPISDTALPTLAVFSPQTQAQKIQVVRVYFQERQQVKQLAAWIEPWEVNYQEGYLVMDVTPDEYNRLIAEGYRVEVDEKLTTLVNSPREYLPGQINAIPGYPCYRTVEETFATAANIAANYPDLAEWSDVGDSWEKTAAGGLPGYDMRVLKLTHETVGGDKPKLFVMSAIHAREYTTAELATRFAEYLVQNYNVDPDVTWLLDYTEIHLLLQSNPDGRKHAETDANWRKNTNQNYCGATSNSRGADLNRNFSFQWGCCGGSSGSPCEETYRGPTPASEPEVQAVQNYVRAIFPDQRGSALTDPAPTNATGIFLDLHSYSQLVLWPWGFDEIIAPNGAQLQTLGRKFAYFNEYTPQQAIALYPTDGTTDDFAYGDLGLAAYTFEMGTAFAESCASFENSVLPENMPALIYAAKASRTPYMTPAGPDALTVTALPNIAAAGDLLTLAATINDTRYNNQSGSEPTQNIAAAAYYLDTPPWESGAVTQTMSAADGSFNSSVENVTATINTTGLSSGRHIAFVRGRDALGNWGAVSAVFFYIIDPATAPVIQGYVRQAVSQQPLDAVVSVGGIFQAQTDPATGFYQMHVISGTYTLQASAANHAAQGVAGVSAFDTQIINQDFDLYPTCTAFSDNIESGNIGWTAQSPWAITTESRHSPTHSWSDSPGGNYANNRNVSLTSPTIDLTHFDNIQVDFWHACNTEAGYDYCHVEVSDNNGTTWTEIGSYDGAQTLWEKVTLPAPMLDNQPDARIRFRLTSDGYETADGWHVDDVQLIGAAASCITYVAPTASFSSSSPDFLATPTTFTNLSSGSALNFEWDFGDSSPIVTTANPTHTYADAGLYTVTLTATNLMGNDTFIGYVEILDPNTAQFFIQKAASVSEINPGEIFTYTLEAGLGLTGTHSYTLALTDTLPAEVSVLTDSIQVNGLPTPMLYLPEGHLISYQQAGVFTDTNEIRITFQVQASSEVISGTWITNRFDGQASTNGDPMALPETAVVNTLVRTHDHNKAQFSINKTASAVEASPGEIFTYTLEAGLVLTGTNPYTLLLTDTLPAEVNVLTDSIRVNGLPAPALYLPETHRISYQSSGIFTGTGEVRITFQVQVNSDVVLGNSITNRLDGQASVNGVSIGQPKMAEITMLIVAPTKYKLFLPLLLR